MFRFSCSFHVIFVAFFTGVNLDVWVKNQASGVGGAANANPSEASNLAISGFMFCACIRAPRFSFLGIIAAL